MELISLKKVSTESKIMLLKELGYGIRGIFVLKDGKQFKDKYTDEPIKIDNMLILPGSTTIIDDNPLSVALYIEEYGDVF